MEGMLTRSPLLLQTAFAQPFVGHARAQRASMACCTASPSNRHVKLEDIRSKLQRLKTSLFCLVLPEPTPTCRFMDLPWATSRSTTSRREVLAATLLASQWLIRPAAAKDAPLDDCVDCLGEVNGGLNACTLNSPSCVSTQNDDEVSETATKVPVRHSVALLVSLASFASGTLCSSVDI